MNLSFAQQPYIYSATDLSIDSTCFFTASEGNLHFWSQQFFIATHLNYKLFKLKKSYTGAQIIVPVSEKTLDFINMINMYAPISVQVIHNQNYKLSEHVKFTNEVLEEAIKMLPTRINSSQFSDQRYVSHIAPILENILDSMKRFSVNSIHIKDVQVRRLWVSAQLKVIMSLFRKVYKKEQRANLVTITVNHLTANTTHLTQDEIERKISIQVQQIVCELLHENDHGVFHLFSKSHRDLMGGYYTQIFVITAYKFNFQTSSIAMDQHQAGELNLPMNQLTYMFFAKTVSLNIHGLDGGRDLDDVKQSFQQYLSSHQYLYYKSKDISPDMIVVK
ncbi:hypothetical protein KTI63_10040 [Acinetobacter guillouiae]|uniref:hypothetical protein n=1 Tax=Acinetobacter guillouiae TaxID=106649 RepID=UPI0021D037D2|nr:hypothetical protein [Acinetobacter guillouiae]MCU4492807.1 hypothetical protein [Acinetobacter guillouiae]